mmetsp:Transcript_27140/g.43588  ORF Transcript_27140/g.43588 Transcript_27140/m.43588 type:complete len:205 (-) Transcript_27140:37-651(-)
MYNSGHCPPSKLNHFFQFCICIFPIAFLCLRAFLIFISFARDAKNFSFEIFLRLNFLQRRLTTLFSLSFRSLALSLLQVAPLLSLGLGNRCRFPFLPVFVLKHNMRPLDRLLLLRLLPLHLVLLRFILPIGIIRRNLLDHLLRLISSRHCHLETSAARGLETAFYAPEMDVGAACYLALLFFVFQRIGWFLVGPSTPPTAAIKE